MEKPFGSLETALKKVVGLKGNTPAEQVFHGGCHHLLQSLEITGNRPLVIPGADGEMAEVSGGWEFSDGSRVAVPSQNIS